MKPEFTQEELLYIEKLMDINASNFDRLIHQICEDFILAQTTDNNELKRLAASRIVENGAAQLVTKSIRCKIENWRKDLK
jgi:hypothetical protein